MLDTGSPLIRTFGLSQTIEMKDKFELKQMLRNAVRLSRLRLIGFYQ